MLLDKVFALINPKWRRCIGVDLGVSAIKLVELSVDRQGQYRVIGTVVQPISRGLVGVDGVGNPDEVAVFLSQAWEVMNTSTRNLVMALPVEAVITQVLSVPAGLSEQELELFVLGEMHQYVPFSLEEASIDFRLLGEESVMVAVAKQDVVSSCVAVAELSGLNAVVVDVENYALERMLRFACRRMEGISIENSVALVDMGASKISCVVQQGGRVLFSHMVRLDVAKELAEEKMRQQPGSFDVFSAYEDEPRDVSAEVDIESDRVVTMLLESMLSMLQQYFSTVEMGSLDFLLLSGGYIKSAALRQKINENVNFSSVKVVNCFSGMQLPAGVGASQVVLRAPLLTVAAGLALRKFELSHDLY